jgi:predicted RNA binding protein YcfA (HicA-like mRNA interferase family)
MVNSGIYGWDRTNGDHAILRWEPPEDHDSDARTVPVPLHDELGRGTLRDIGEQAGMRDFQEFKDWIDRNR